MILCTLQNAVQYDDVDQYKTGVRLQGGEL